LTALKHHVGPLSQIMVCETVEISIHDKPLDL